MLCNAPRAHAIALNQRCHARGIAFIATEARGVFGSVFCDFGDAFVVSDPDGEPPFTSTVASVLPVAETTLLVTVPDDRRHQLATGDLVTFRDVPGLAHLDGAAPLPVTVTGPYTFTIPSSRSPSHLDLLGSGGVVEQVKSPRTLRFLPLAHALATPEPLLLRDGADPDSDRPRLLHVAFQALEQFTVARCGQLPVSGDAADAETVLQLAHAIETPEIHWSAANDALVRALALSARGLVAPMAALLGGLVAQEALKACSAKLSPIRQWLYVDAAESWGPVTVDECAPRDGRYDGQLAVWGRQAHAKLRALRLFLVGAGAIGGELLKNWALMGLGSAGGSAQLHVADMELIQKSHLHRHLLFRSQDVGRAKAPTAAAAVAAINPHVHVQPHVARVGDATENTLFDDAFYERLDGVCTALDNVPARLYMDGRCLVYGLPMLESGTLGTKGNTQVIVPHVTEHYGASRDPPEKTIPICTLHNFPHAIDHTLQWARDWFEGCFFHGPRDVQAYVATPDFVATLRARNADAEALPTGFEDCAAIIRLCPSARVSVGHGSAAGQCTEQASVHCTVHGWQRRSYCRCETLARDRERALATVLLYRPWTAWPCTPATTV